jgi:hypothetical protein
MNEMVKITPEQPEKIGSVEKIITEFGGVFEDEEGVAHAVAMEGEGVVPVPKDVAKVISLSLRTQEKALTGKYPNLGKLLLLLNCRKSVFVTSGTMEMNEALDKDSEDINGVNALLADVERLQNSGYEGFLIEHSYIESISEYLDEYEGKFPVVVHMFEMGDGTTTAGMVEDHVMHNVPIPAPIISKLHRIHSFIVLGEDEDGYILFQKEGPKLQQPFMVASFNRFSYELDEDRKGLVFIGPL